MPATDRAALVGRYRRYLGAGRARLAEYIGAGIEVSSSGSTVTTADGASLLDCGGYSVFLLGHCHEAVVEAVVEQVRRHPLATRLLLEPTIAEAAQALVSLAPEGLDKAFLVNSGAEATELALKLARAHGRTELVCMRGGYHGKTLGALSVTSNQLYQSLFAPLLDATAVDYGDPDALREVLAGVPGRAAVILEPVLGEGGVVVPPRGYLAEVERLCRQYDATLIVDEIQTGLGRCGRTWAHQPEIECPDILLVGKALSGGVVPVAAVLATDVLFKPVADDPALHSSTFGGSPLASAAVLATLRTLDRERIVERAGELGDILLRAVVDVCAPYRELIVEVRGAGLLLGIEFVRPDVTAEVATTMLHHGVIVNHSLNDHAVLRITPPAVMTPDEVERLVDCLHLSLDEVSRSFVALATT
ncbi:aspartate aminotransferase family protein [Rhodococcus triatomae]|uniref:Putrescine aminotransferase n=1 Tax=Rhodococcus triatomae TaxID=300028 RepID=A0A1G8NG40_9NOCA|nr:aminotransferase class III-fold pyridoxal phosphate-dependent enzyme [Rhodococcus triatomae]QNG19998.1 aspartate aminotransferase family protein [Rhodococcus triatomae]QNG24087.1 aspartate aminotransferase family protein [Rhodococcus triatomae]SDI79102.1 putrescine aminotransferase [Rhodococcus triatomae]